MAHNIYVYNIVTCEHSHISLHRYSDVYTYFRDENNLYICSLDDNNRYCYSVIEGGNIRDLIRIESGDNEDMKYMYALDKDTIFMIFRGVEDGDSESSCYIVNVNDENIYRICSESYYVGCVKCHGNKYVIRYSDYCEEDTRYYPDDEQEIYGENVVNQIDVCWHE